MWWNSVKELIEYARSENPDAYKILEMANQITTEWKLAQPPVTNDPSIPLWVQQA